MTPAPGRIGPRGTRRFVLHHGLHSAAHRCRWRDRMLTTLLLCCSFPTPAGARATHPAQEPVRTNSVRFFVDPATNSDDPERRMAYGLNVAPPWKDGGSLFINLPEHL